MGKNRKILFLIILLGMIFQSFSSLSNLVTANDLTNFNSSQETNIQAQKTFTTFLNEIAGIKTKDYYVTILKTSNTNVFNSNKTQTTISAIVANQQRNFSVAMSIIDGKVYFYSLYLFSGTLEGSDLSISACLTNTKKAISNYKEIFDAEYCNGFDSILPSTLSTTNKTMNNDTLTVNIQVYEQLKTPLKYIVTTWNRCVGNFTVKDLVIQSTISKTGVLTSFLDSMGVYKIGTEDISLTREAALKTAMPYIEEYAKANDRKIEATDVTFAYARDLDGSRGDSILIYPRWCVSAQFDNSIDKDVYGFNVLIWADNGAVASANPQGAYQSDNNMPYEPIFMIIMGASIIVIFSTILLIKKKRKISFKSNPKLMVCAGALVVVLLAPQFIQSVSATPATILGSTHDVDQDEIERIENITLALDGWCDSIGYDTHYWYGSSTTASNLYIAAYDHGEDRSFVFYDGHGGQRDLVYWFGGNMYSFPQIVMGDNSGNAVYDKDIYDNSYSQSSGHHKVCIFWSCNLANIIGGIEFIPISGYGYCAHGMPFAWLHDNSLSSNGYYYSDYSGQAFVGWQASCPFLGNLVDGVPQAGYSFLYDFYHEALSNGVHINGALDSASFQVFSETFDQTDFYSGYTDNMRMPPEQYGPMVVYGQGEAYICNPHYVSDAWGEILYGTGGYWYPYGAIGGSADGVEAGLVGYEQFDSAAIICEMDEQVTGTHNIYLYGNAYSEFNTGVHVLVYVSNDYPNNPWTNIFSQYVYPESSNNEIYVGTVSSDWRYIGVSVMGEYYPGAFMFDYIIVK